MIQASLAQHILENITTAVLWFDKELLLQAINPATETLLEVSAKQICGTHVSLLLPESNPLYEALQQVMDKHYHMIERGIRLVLASTHCITVDCYITPIYSHSHEGIENILVELTQVDQQLRVTREENLILQQQAVHNMIRGLAHEIKNPLGGLRGAAQLLERQLPNAQLREYTQIIIGEADRLQNLLDRIFAPSTLLHTQQINIHQILMHVRQLILSETNTGIFIDCDFDPSIPELVVDSDRLIQAVLNIMRNAVQAMEEFGKIQLRTRIQRQMTLGNKRHKLVVRIDIIDNGPGIPEEMLHQIFYPLVTGRAEGSGLGLSIAQALVNQHHGLIECSSQPGETIFTLWLPMDISNPRSK